MEPPYDMELRRHCEQAWLQSWEKLTNLGVSSSWVSKGLSNQWVVQAWIWGWGWSMKLGLPHLIVQNQDSSAMRIMLIMCFAMFLQCLFVPMCVNYRVLCNSENSIQKMDSNREPSSLKQQRQPVLLVMFRSWQSRLLFVLDRTDPTTFASHHCHVRTYLQIKSFNRYCSFFCASARELSVAYVCKCMHVCKCKRTYTSVAWHVCTGAN